MSVCVLQYICGIINESICNLIYLRKLDISSNKKITNINHLINLEILHVV